MFRGLTIGGVVALAGVLSLVVLTGKLSTKTSVGRVFGWAKDGQLAGLEQLGSIGPFEPLAGAHTYESRFSRPDVAVKRGSFRYAAVVRKLAEKAARESRSIPEGDGHGPLPEGAGLGAAVGEYLKELGSATQYVGLFLAVPGLVYMLRRRCSLETVALLALFAGFTLLLLRLYLTSGYISMRHVLVPVLCLAPFAGIGAECVVRNLAPRLGAVLLGTATNPRRASRIAAALIITVAALLYVPVYAKPLHRSRAGALAAASWLARNAHPDEAVLDPHLVSGALAGLRTYPLSALSPALKDRSLSYVVMDVADLARTEEPYGRIAALIAERGEEVARFEVPTDPDATVVVFRLRKKEAHQRIARTPQSSPAR